MLNKGIFRKLRVRLIKLLSKGIESDIELYSEDNNYYDTIQQLLPSKGIPGLNCPNCTNFISTDINMLLVFSSIECPHCGLSLAVDQVESKETIKVLRNNWETLKEFADNVEEKKSFKG